MARKSLNLAGLDGELEEPESAGAIQIERDVIAFETAGDFGEAGGAGFGEGKIDEGGRGVERGPEINFVTGLVKRDEAELDAGVGGRAIESDVEKKAGNRDQQDRILAGIAVILQRALRGLQIEIAEALGGHCPIFFELGAVARADHALAGAIHAADDATLMRANGADDVKIVRFPAIDDDRFEPGFVGGVIGGDRSCAEANRTQGLGQGGEIGEIDPEDARLEIGELLNFEKEALCPGASAGGIRGTQSKRFYNRFGDCLDGLASSDRHAERR